MTTTDKQNQLPVPIWVIIAAVAAFWWFNTKREPAPTPAPVPDVVTPDNPTPEPTPTPTPTPTPEQTAVVESQQLAATCQVLASIAAAQEFKDTAQIHDAWNFVDRHALGGRSLSPKAREWIVAAELRIQTVLGEAGATLAKPMTPELSQKVAEEFTSLAEELRTQRDF